MSDQNETTEKRDGPAVIVTTRMTCDGCRHLTTERWRFEGENDDMDSGTTATCEATPDLKSISAYWSSTTKTPDWCPRRIELP